MLSPQENNWFSKLNYLTEKEYENYINSRQKQIESLKKVGLKLAFTSNKIYTGSLSKGCEICGNGDWSCLFINGLCTADCSFCPQDREQRIERDPFTENLPMPDARL